MGWVDGIFQYQANTASNTNTLNQVKGTGRPLPVQGQELVPGKVFEGTVTEMKNGQVTLGLSDGKTISARMEQGVSLVKGQPMLFEVKANTGEQISIRPVMLESAQNPTLMKALEAAGMKANPRNLSMVNQMMMGQLPIDKNSLMQMARAVGNFPQADMQTLVQMQKLGFTINEDTLNQFQNYKNGQQAMLPDMITLMDGLAEFSGQAFGKEGILENIMLPANGQPAASQGQAAGASQMLGFQQQLLDILLGADALSQEAAVQKPGIDGQLGEALSPGVTSQPGEANPPSAVQNPGLAGQAEGANPPAAAQNPGLAGQADTAQDPGLAGQAGTAQDPGLAGQAGAVQDKGLAGQAGTAQDPGLANPPGEMGQAGTVRPGEAGQGAAVQDPGLAGQPGEVGQEPGQAPLDKVLDQRGQANLAKLLQEIPGAGENGRLLPNGRLDASLAAGELLQQIMEAVKHAKNLDGGILKKLFSSKEYKGLLKQAMADQWLLSPENLREEGAVKELYQRMSRQLEQIQQALSQAGKEGASLGKTAQSLQSNIEFMNQLNQAYAYAQLPLKLRNQHAHSDLYVYTNKKNLRDKGGELSALLHLDLDHLGSTDIFVKMKGTAVQTEFYLENESSYRLVAGFTGQLVERLQEKGYQCEVKVENRQKQQDFVEDFLEHDKPAGKLHRYSFDVKA